MKDWNLVFSVQGGLLERENIEEELMWHERRNEGAVFLNTAIFDKQLTDTEGKGTLVHGGYRWKKN